MRMSHSDLGLARLALIAFMVVTAVEATGQTRNKTSSKPKSASTAPLTLSLSDLYEKNDLLAQADALNSQGEDGRDSSDYVARYRELQRGLQLVKPPVSKWTSSEQEKVRSVPAPSEEGIRRYEERQKLAANRVQEKVDAAQNEFRRREEIGIRQEEQNQRNREAEIRAAEAEARTEAYYRSMEDLDGYYYPYPVYNYPLRPTHHRNRPGIR